MANLPQLKDLYNNELAIVQQDALVVLLNQPPKAEWVKVHPFIANYKYLPIERVEFLLKTIFKRYRIEITGQGVAFNGVWVTVRLHYLHPITGEWDYHDGIGAAQLQTKKGTSPSDLININNGAISMAFPIAKTVAVKDAADHFGTLFGSDLNRKDVITYEADLTLQFLDEFHPLWSKACTAIAAKQVTVEKTKEKYSMTPETETYLNELYNGTIQM
jgi:hypothetical protein